jgi:hypothetical protein
MIPALAAGLAAITSGTADPGDPGVAALLDGADLICTGTLISDRVILTAAHCVTASGPGLALFGANRSEPERAIAIAERRVHPDFDPTTLDNDVALLLLASSPGYAPWPVWDEPLSSADRGGSVRLVGFGRTAAGTGDAGIKRQGTATIQIVTAGTFAIEPAPSQTCLGDSGGPAFALEDGTEVLIGVTSFGDPDCAFQAVAVRADVHAGRFILSYLIETSVGTVAAGGRCVRDQNCAAGTCVAGSHGGFSYCSIACGRSSDCPGAMACATGTCRYSALEPGAPDAACEHDAACASDRCARVEPGTAGVCSARCFPENQPACPAGAACLSDAAHPGSSSCFPAAPTAGGCNTAHGAASWLITLAIAALCFRGAVKRLDTPRSSSRPRSAEARSAEGRGQP